MLGNEICLCIVGIYVVAQTVKNLPTMQVGKTSWRREWQPTLVFLPGESHGQRSLLAKNLPRLSDEYLQILFFNPDFQL